MTWERNPDDTEVNVDDDGKSDNLVFKKATLSGLTALRVETSSLNVTYMSSTRQHRLERTISLDFSNNAESIRNFTTFQYFCQLIYTVEY